MENQKNKVFNIISKLKAVKQLNDLIGSSRQNISVKFLTGSLKSILIGSTYLSSKKNIFIISQNEKTLNQWYNDLQLFIKSNDIAYFTEPKQKKLPGDNELPSASVNMIDALNTLQQNSSFIALAKADIFDKLLPMPDDISSNRISLQAGEHIHFDDFWKNLALSGFTKCDFVSSPGEIAVRGGIVDVFPLAWENPLRIEFFGDEIESLREFNPLSQRSIRSHKEIEFIASIFHESQTKKGSILDYISNDTIFVIDEPELLSIDNPEFSVPESFRAIKINGLGDADLVIHSTSQPMFNSSVKNLSAFLRQKALYNPAIIISADSRHHLRRIYDLVDNTLEMSEDDESSEEVLASKSQVQSHTSWLEHSLSEGFVLDDYSLIVLTEHQIFDRQRIQESGKKKYSGGITLKELKQLHIGDFVVHTDKGIGRFDGFERVKFGGSEQDCVRLIFAEGDKLYVHLNYIHKIQKYSAQEGVVPKLSKLGTSEWLRKKEKAKRRLKDIARELITLYASRKMNKGFAFSGDSVWQKEFEASFMFEDTADQAKSTGEVKKDMESETPMDRLICGDVGFGKTEIAIRAAFKAVQNGKQVAVLVPTTILAQQHYMTFKDRLNKYPVIIDSISRFRSSAEQKQIVSRSKEGKIDVLIGTHRLLSKDVAFSDLGLLIIDEEHRFGVGAKEKLRELRATIDTLTLTATPIPRTLNFSLMGARDLSVIETPPRNRLPIITEILEWNDEAVVNAIEYEIARNGQVFFVTDKIQDIDNIARKLQMLMPRFRFAVAHGQLTSHELESIMEKFIKGKYDVLITTKIVESGLDIPNANTMIINRSDKFGLAELYQLRGRVGRSNIQAYCYLMIPPAKTLSTNSLRRLQAIEEFTDLGSGFQLAMRDLEIRGAGNLLGPEQSGYINDIGFEMFHKILDEAVNELRVQEFSDLFKDKIEAQRKYVENSEVAIIMNSDALLPPDFILNDTERFTYYKKLYNIKTNLELEQLRDDLQDRFGKLPYQANELLFAVKLRLAALNTGFQKIALMKQKFTAEFPAETNTEFYELAFPLLIDFLPEFENAKIVQNQDKLSLEVEIENRDEAVEFLWRVKKLFETIE